jgi:hypothetical protein
MVWATHPPPSIQDLALCGFPLGGSHTFAHLTGQRQKKNQIDPSCKALTAATSSSVCSTT